jgi:hypothetical protein
MFGLSGFFGLGRLNSGFAVPLFEADKGGTGGGSGFLDGTFDDDPNLPDDDMGADLDDAGDATEDLEEDASDDFTDDADKDLEDGQDDGAGDEIGKDKQPLAQTQQTQKTPGPKMVTMTQEELDRIISERLERDRRVREDQERQRQQQAQQQQQFTQWYNNELAAQTKFYADKLGLDDDTAAIMAKRDVDSQVRILQAEQVSKQSQESWQAQQKIAKYQQDKMEQVSKNPLVAKYIKEIDTFAQNGMAGVDFMVAAKYVLGEKIASGELLDTVTSAVEQKTLKNIGKRQKLAVEKDSQPGASTTPRLTPEQRRICKNLGISEKLYLANLKKK